MNSGTPILGYYIRLIPNEDSTKAYLRHVNGPDIGRRVVYTSADQAIEFLNDPKVKAQYPFAHLEPSYKQGPTNTNMGL